MSKVKARDAAYRLIARAALGEPFPDELLDPEAFGYALELIMNDTRTRRTAAERSIQQSLTAVVVVWQFAKDPGALAKMSATYGSILGEILEAPRGEKVDP